MSRTSKPKQYLSLGTSHKSLLTATIDRISQVSEVDKTLIVTASDQLELVRQHAGVDFHALLEPCPKYTAACVSYAAEFILETIGDVPLVCLPADHVIQNEVGFSAVIS